MMNLDCAMSTCCYGVMQSRVEVDELLVMSALELMIFWSFDGFMSMNARN